MNLEMAKLAAITTMSCASIAGICYVFKKKTDLHKELFKAALEAGFQNVEIKC